MSVTSTEKNLDIPTLAIYSISGDKLIKEGTFRIEFARWDNNGSYLGNEPDTRNDFSKVNTVGFKLGCEVNESILNKPYVIVLKKSNTQSRHYERFENPPITYSGEANYPDSLSIEDFPIITWQYGWRISNDFNKGYKRILYISVPNDLNP